MRDPAKPLCQLVATILSLNGEQNPADRLLTKAISTSDWLQFAPLTYDNADTHTHTNTHTSGVV